MRCEFLLLEMRSSTQAKRTAGGRLKLKRSFDQTQMPKLTLKDSRSNSSKNYIRALRKPTGWIREKPKQHEYIFNGMASKNLLSQVKSQLQLLALPWLCDDGHPKFFRIQNVRRYLCLGPSEGTLRNASFDFESKTQQKILPDGEPKHVFKKLYFVEIYRMKCKSK